MLILLHSIDDNIVWTIVVKNNRFDDASNVIVRDILPDTLSFIKANANKGSYDNGIWTVGNLAPDEIQKLTLTTSVESIAYIIQTKVMKTDNKHRNC